MNIISDLKDEDINKISTFLNLYNNCIKESDKTMVTKLVSSLEKLAKSNNLLFNVYINVLKNYYISSSSASPIFSCLCLY